jgi:hypothetical protein
LDVAIFRADVAAAADGGPVRGRVRLRDVNDVNDVNDESMMLFRASLKVVVFTW